MIQTRTGLKICIMRVYEKDMGSSLWTPCEYHTEKLKLLQIDGYNFTVLMTVRLLPAGHQGNGPHPARSLAEQFIPHSMRHSSRLHLGTEMAFSLPPSKNWKGNYLVAVLNLKSTYNLLSCHKPRIMCNSRLPMRLSEMIKLKPRGVKLCLVAGRTPATAVI